MGLRLFQKLQILDKPGPDVPVRDRVPTMQGLIGIIAVVVGLLVSGQGDLIGGGAFVGLWVGVALIIGVTGIDELGRIVHRRYRIGPLVRLLTQIAAVIVAVWLSYDVLFPLSLFGYEISGLIGIIMMIGWFLLFINAINWFDGVYGLSTGVTSIGFWVIVGLIMLVVFPAFEAMSDTKTVLLGDTVMLAGLFGVMTMVGAWIEYAPKGLMRDVGTMSFGFILAYLSLVGGAKVGTLIVVLALPLMDAAWVILDRVVRRKTNPMRGDFTHLHYRLMALGRSRSEVRWSIWIASVCLGLLMLLQGTNSINKLIIFVMGGVLFFGINIYLFWIKGIESEYDWIKSRNKK